MLIWLTIGTIQSPLGAGVKQLPTFEHQKAWLQLCPWGTYTKKNDKNWAHGTTRLVCESLQLAQIIDRSQLTNVYLSGLSEQSNEGFEDIWRICSESVMFCKKLLQKSPNHNRDWELHSGQSQCTACVGIRLRMLGMLRLLLIRLERNSPKPTAKLKLQSLLVKQTNSWGFWG